MRPIAYERSLQEGLPTANKIRSMRVPFGTMLNVPIRAAMSQIEYRKYKVIGCYPDFVLCERVAGGGSYLTCFSKRDLYFGTLEAEEDEE